MGMYDEVKFEADLPGYEFLKNMELQTKDLDCLLENYRISPEGRLLREAYDIEDQSDPTKTGWERMIGSMTRIHKGWEDTNFHGMLHCAGDDPNSDKYCTYTFKFTDGKFTGEITKEVWE